MSSSDSTATPCRADSGQSPRGTGLTPPGQPLDHRPKRRPALGRRPKGALHVAAAAPSPSRPRSPTPACPDCGWLKIGSAAEAFRQASFSRSHTRARTPTGKAARWSATPSGRRSRRSLRVSLGPSGKSVSSRAASRAAPAARPRRSRGRLQGSRLVRLALRPGFRLKARSPSIEPPGAGDDTGLGKQSSRCRASAV